MKETKVLLMVLMALIFGSALTTNSIVRNYLGTSTAIAQEDDWDSWDDEGDEEDAFGNIMETTFAIIDSVDFGAPTAGAPAKVTAKITLQDEEGEASITSVKLSYSVNGGAVQTVDMTGADGTYTAQIPAQAAGAKVDFYLTITDSNNNVTTGALPGAANMVPGVADMDNSADIVADDADLLGIAAGYDSENLYVNFDVQGKINGGTVEPAYIQLYGVKITNPDTEQGEGLMVGKLWVYLPLATEKAVQEKFMPMLLEQGKEYIEKIGRENIDRVMQTGMMVLDIQKLMGGNIMEGLLFAAQPEAKIEGGKFMGKIKRAPLGDNPSGYLRIITLTAANASLDSFMPIPLNCSNFITLYTSNYSYTVK